MEWRYTESHQAVAMMTRPARTNIAPMMTVPEIRSPRIANDATYTRTNVRTVKGYTRDNGNFESATTQRTEPTA